MHAGTEMSGPDSAQREEFRQAEPEGFMAEIAFQQGWWSSFVAVGGNEFLISQVVNKYILPIEKIYQLLMVNHGIYPFRLCP